MKLEYIALSISSDIGNRSGRLTLYALLVESIGIRESYTTKLLAKNPNRYFIYVSPAQSFAGAILRLGLTRQETYDDN